MVAALRAWVTRVAEKHPDVVRVGYIGSYAREDWGPGSDLDVVIVLRASDRPFIERAADWDLSTMPVPTDVLVYTEAEIAELRTAGARLATVLETEAIWLLTRA